MSRAAPIPVASRPAMAAADWAFLALLSVFWGGTFFFAKLALVAFPPITLALCRVAVAGLALFAVMRICRVAMPTERRAWLAFLGMGLLNNVLPFTLIFWGQSSMPREVAASLASILNATTPIFGVLVAHVLTRDERLDAGKLVGVTLGFAGAALIIAPQLAGALAKGSGGAELPLLGMLSCLAASLVYAFAGIFGRRFKRMGIAPMPTALGQLTASSVMLLPLAALIDRPWTLPAPGPAPVAALLGLALISTAAAYVIYFRILASAGATNVLLVTFLVPVSAIFLGSVFLGERLGIVHIAGMALIGIGLVAIDGRLAAHLGWRRGLRTPAA